MSTDSDKEILPIGERLREERKKLGLSQEALASKIFVSGVTLKKYEGNKTYPTARELIFMHGLGMDIDYILTGVKMSYGVAQNRAFYTPAQRLGEYIAGLTLSEEDADLVKVLSTRMSKSQDEK